MYYILRELGLGLCKIICVVKLIVDKIILCGDTQSNNTTQIRLCSKLILFLYKLCGVPHI